MHVSQTSNHCIFSENGLRFHLRASIFQNFPGGACPQTPLALTCYACLLCTIFTELFIRNCTKGPHSYNVWPNPGHSALVMTSDSPGNHEGLATSLLPTVHWIAVVNGRVDRHGCLSGSRVEKLKLLETFKNKLRNARRHSHRVEQV